MLHFDWNEGVSNVLVTVQARLSFQVLASIATGEIFETRFVRAVSITTRED